MSGSTYSAPTAKAGMGAKFIGGNSADGRAFNDFYPTPAKATHAFGRAYAHYLGEETIWEPCAGDGAMIDALKCYVTDVKEIIGTDIAPRRADIAAVDVLDPRIDTARRFRDRIEVVVTNPPFNLSEKIIRRILMPGFLPNLRLFAIVSKATFWHAAERMALWEEHTPYAIHPLTWRLDFQGKGRPVMECAWIVWTPGSAVDRTIYQPLRRPE